MKRRKWKAVKTQKKKSLTGFLFKFLDISETLEGKIKEQLCYDFLTFATSHRLVYYLCKKLLKTYLDTVCFFLI